MGKLFTAKMGKLFTVKVGKLFTRLLGNYLTATLGKFLDIYSAYLGTSRIGSVSKLRAAKR